MSGMVKKKTVEAISMNHCTFGKFIFLVISESCLF